MRIGMIVDIFKPHVSGVTTYVAQNKQILEQQGYKVYVFTFGDPAYEDDELYVIRAPGLPPLGIDSPGAADTISDNEKGSLSSCDMAEFTAKLMRLVTEPNTRRRFAARSRKLARPYDIHRTSQAVLAEYERLAAERGERGLSGLRQRVGRFFRGQNTR